MNKVVNFFITPNIYCTGKIRNWILNKIVAQPQCFNVVVSISNNQYEIYIDGVKIRDEYISFGKWKSVEIHD